MKIAICGGGLVGSYLYRLLSQTSLGDVTVFEKPEPPGTNCGIRPCAWGTSSGLEEMLGYASLDPASYIMRAFDAIVMNGVKVKARALVIDKPKLITDLLKGAKIVTSPVPVNEFDRIIDSTGNTRAFLPSIEKDIFANCIQFRVSSQEAKEFSVDISNLGYAWCFPMSAGEYHIGAGSISMSPNRMLQKLGWLKNCLPLCNCSGKTRLTAPYFSTPFMTMKNNEPSPIWGVGEAIGCVAPLSGEGIIPGMKSARILVDNWANRKDYEKSILKEFAWMKAERRVLDKALQGKRLGLLDARVLMNSGKRFRMNLAYKLSLSLLRSINRIDF
jgi:flavin-dependent dehydrogenase